MIEPHSDRKYQKNGSDEGRATEVLATETATRLATEALVATGTCAVLRVAELPHGFGNLVLETGEVKAEEISSPETDSNPQITPEQENAVERARLLRKDMLQKSENGSKRISDAEFKPIEEKFRKTLLDSVSVMPQQLEDLNTALNKSFRDALAAQRDDHGLTLDDAVRVQQIVKLHLKAVDAHLDAAILALPNRDVIELNALQKRFDAEKDVIAREFRNLSAGSETHEIAEIQHAHETTLGKLEAELRQSQRRINPELAFAIEARAQLLNDPETKLVLAHAEQQKAIKKLTTAPDVVRLCYAEALAIQGRTSEAEALLKIVRNNIRVRTR